MTRHAPLGAAPLIDVHILSFEGPDVYSRAGGIASRVTGLTRAMAEEGFETHHWFIGDPSLREHETRGTLTLHRWCQWISRYHAAGVYDGEEGKRNDYSASLPPVLAREHLIPRLRDSDRRAVVLAEEWQTVDAVLHLDALLRAAGVRDRAAMFWNANNVFGFHRIDWTRLAAAAQVTTVSRYMRHLMWRLSLDPLVIPNGIPDDCLRPPERMATHAFRRAFRDRLVLTKMARWDPDKRWLLAIDIVAELKRRGWRPLLLARGGVEPHGAEVLARAAAAGLRTVERSIAGPGTANLMDGLRDLREADVVNIQSYLSPEVSRVLFRASAAVLANSGREPFGLVGLETMAAGGIACIGGTGEDYAVPGWNSLLLQTQDPREFIGLFERLLRNPAENRAIRTRAAATARRYTWNEIIRRDLLPRISFVSVDERERPQAAPPKPRRASDPAAVS